MPLDFSRIRALCFDVDGTIADTDDHLVAQLAELHRCRARRERPAGRAAGAPGGDGAETPVHGAYARLDRLGLDVPVSRLRAAAARGQAARGRPAHTRNPEAIDEVPHEMMAGVQQMLEALARHFPMCTISTGGAPRVERFLEHYGVRSSSPPWSARRPRAG